MIKRTLIAIALIALLAPVVQAANTYDPDTYPPFAVYSFDVGQSDDQAVKVDGKETVRWPYEYKPLEICQIPLKMKLGMYIRVQDCDVSANKIILTQKDCGDLDKWDDNGAPKALEAKNWPCYYGCRTIKVMANFTALVSGKVVSNDTNIVNPAKTAVTANGEQWAEVVGLDGNYHNVAICVTAWEAAIEKGAAGDEVNVGYVSVIAKPKV